MNMGQQIIIKEDSYFMKLEITANKECSPSVFSMVNCRARELLSICLRLRYKRYNLTG